MISLVHFSGFLEADYLTCRLLNADHAPQQHLEEELNASGHSPLIVGCLASWLACSARVPIVAVFGALVKSQKSTAVAALEELRGISLACLFGRGIS